MGSINNVIAFLTNPQGIGFPILIGGGLAIILFLMNKTSKGWQKADSKIEKNKDAYRKNNLPLKPF